MIAWESGQNYEGVLVEGEVRQRKMRWCEDGGLIQQQDILPFLEANTFYISRWMSPSSFDAFHHTFVAIQNLGW